MSAEADGAKAATGWFRIEQLPGSWLIATSAPSSQLQASLPFMALCALCPVHHHSPCEARKRDLIPRLSVRRIALLTMRRRSHAQLSEDEGSDVDTTTTGQSPDDKDDPPPPKRHRTRHTSSRSPPISEQLVDKPQATASLSSSPPPVKSGSPPLASPSSFDCSPTLSILPDYFRHHHSLVTSHATALSTHLQRNISRTQQLASALYATLQQLDQADDSARRAQAQLQKEKRKGERKLSELAEEHNERLKKLTEEKQREVEEAVAERGRELDRMRREVTREKRERREVEEREKASEAKWAEVEKRQKAVERKLTIAEKKNKKYEEAEERHQAAMQQLQQQLSTARSASSTASASSSSSSPVSSGASSHEVQSLHRQLDSLQVRLSYYESGPASLPTLSSRDLALLAASLQQHLDAVKEEEQARKECKVCMTDSASVVFVPCGHMICCVKCADGCKDCPVCRVKIDKRIQTKS